MKLYVDADACPVKEEAIRVARRHELEVVMVSNQWLRAAKGPGVQRIVVGEGADAADKWIAERIGEGDIAVTDDIPLAARCLEKGARVISNAGKSFTEDGIGTALAMRELMSHLRDRGEVRGNAPTFSKDDRSRFLGALEQAIQAITRQALRC